MPDMADYARQLRQELPEVAYRPVPARLAWLVFHLALISACMIGIIGQWTDTIGVILLSLTIGHSYACLALLAHEILHGTVVRQRWGQLLLGGLCFLPHCLPPGLWQTWHNRFHHGHVGQRGKDPDGFGDPVLYRRSWLLRNILKFLPGSGYVRSATYFLFYFTFHVVFVLFLHSRKYRYWPQARWQRETAIFALEVGIWISVAFLVGLLNFTLIYVIPLMVANAIQLTYVTTNHWLCDETEDHNDPLRNSLSVKVPWLVDLFHLNASYHAEHHLAPNVNPRYAPLVHESMVSRYGPRCRRLPLLSVLRMTYATPRVHLGESELVNLDTGEVYSTLGPHAEPPGLVGRVDVPVKRKSNQSNLRRDSDQTTQPLLTVEEKNDSHLLPLPLHKPLQIKNDSLTNVNKSDPTIPLMIDDQATPSKRAA